MTKKYMLEIYFKGDTEAVFESDTPFMNINVGDILNNRSWDTSSYEGKVLKVIKLEHFLFKTDDSVEHKIGVYTIGVEDTEEERLKP